MKKILFVIIILLFSLPCQAELSKRQHYDVHHITGSCLGTAYLNHVVGISWKRSAVTMFIFGIVWETLDEVSKEIGYRQDVFDYRQGFEIGDVFRNGIGISLSFPIRK